MSERIKAGETDRIFLFAADSSGAGVTGATVTGNIRRKSDGYYWNGSTFQSGLSTLNFTQLDSTNQPGIYYYDFVAPASLSDILLVYGTSSTGSVTNKPYTGEIKVGGWLFSDISTVSSTANNIYTILSDTILELVNGIVGSLQRLEETVLGLYREIKNFADIESGIRALADIVKSSFSDFTPPWKKK